MIHIPQKYSTLFYLLNRRLNWQINSNKQSTRRKELKEVKKSNKNLEKLKKEN